MVRSAQLGRPRDISRRKNYLQCFTTANYMVKFEDQKPKEEDIMIVSEPPGHLGSIP
jgi:hypothetical protein